MTNFYSDYSFSPEDFETISSILKKTAGKLIEYIDSLSDLRTSRYLEDFRIIPVQYFDITPALYDAGTIFDSEDLKKWFDAETDKETKINMLRSKGKYVKFYANRGFPDESGDIPDKHTIVDFKLYDAHGNRLVYNTDYVFKNNCLYLFDYASWDIRNGNYFKITNVAIDFNTTNDMLGKNLELQHQPTKMSKVEFNEIVRVLTLAMLKGGTVAGVTDGLSALNNDSPEGIQIVDKPTENQEMALKWGSVLDSKTYSPFDFIVYYPASFNEYRVSLLKDYLNKVRHSYTKYTELAYDYYEDLYEGILSDDWWDFIQRPFVDTKGYSALEGKDNTRYHVLADHYYIRDSQDNIILEAHLTQSDIEALKQNVLSNGEVDSNGNSVPVTKEFFLSPNNISDQENYWDSLQILLDAVYEEYDTSQDWQNTEEPTEDNLIISHALTNCRYSRTSYTMMSY